MLVPVQGPPLDLPSYWTPSSWQLPGSLAYRVLLLTLQGSEKCQGSCCDSCHQPVWPEPWGMMQTYQRGFLLTPAMHVPALAACTTYSDTQAQTCFLLAHCGITQALSSLCPKASDRSIKSAFSVFHCSLI